MAKKRSVSLVAFDVLYQRHSPTSPAASNPDPETSFNRARQSDTATAVIPATN